MAAQHDLILGRSWDQSINQLEMINLRYYICVKMYGSVTVIMDRKPKLDEGQAAWTAKPVTPYPAWCHWQRKATCPKVTLPSALLCFAAQIHPAHLSALRACSKWSRTSVPGNWLLPSSAIFTWWLWKFPKRDALPQLNWTRLIANSIANCRVKPLHISTGFARKIAPINEAHCRLVYIQLTLFKHQIICVWLWGQIHPIIFHLVLFYCLACSAELRSYSWSKTSLSSLPSFRGLYRCCTKSQPPVNSHHLVVSSSRLRVSRHRAGSPFWPDSLLPGFCNQKLSSGDIVESAWIGKINFTSMKQLQAEYGHWHLEGKGLLCFMTRSMAFMVQHIPGMPSAVSGTIMPWKAAEATFHP